MTEAKENFRREITDASVFSRIGKFVLYEKSPAGNDAHFCSKSNKRMDLKYMKCQYVTKSHNFLHKK